MDDDKMLQLEIIKRLDILIKLMLESRPDFPKEKPDRPQIEKLARLGMSPSEIGRIMGIPTTRVGAHLAQIKKKQGVKRHA